MLLKEFDGIFFNVIRDGEFESLGNITTVTDVKCLSFANDEESIKRALKKDSITGLIVPPDWNESEVIKRSNCGVAIAEKPKTAFHMMHNYLFEHGLGSYRKGMNKTIVGNNCRIHPTASIAQTGVVIGNNVVIEEHVIIRAGVTIGDNVVIMAGAYIGYSACLAGRDMSGNLLPLKSAGEVKIGNNVQIGSYAVVSKGLFPFECAEIGDYSLVGYAVDLSHNDRIGKNVIVLDQSQVCGNTVLEDNVHISPHAIVSNRLNIGTKVHVAIGAVVVNSIKAGMRVAGNYAIENSKFLLWHRKKLSTK